MSSVVAVWLTRRAYLAGFGGVALLQATGCASATDAARARDGRIGMARRGPIETPPVRPAGPPERDAPRAQSEAAVEAAPKIPTLALPPRPKGAETGSSFLARLEGLGRGAIDDQVVAAITAGNVPDHVRTLAPVTLSEGGVVRGRIFVTKDYLCIGSNEDFMRMPMTSAAAQKLADLLDASLPTPHIVDLVYAQAEARLPPSYIDGGPTDDSLADFQEHQNKLEARRKAKGLSLDVLTAGHKKDIVLSTRLTERDDRVAIYGWHKGEGDVIQSLSCKHSCRYADYSHGVRLVAQAMVLDGKPTRVSEVLANEETAALLSSEGVLPILSYPTELPAYEPDPKKKKKQRS